MADEVVMSTRVCGERNRWSTERWTSKRASTKRTRHTAQHDAFDVFRVDGARAPC